jgi:hypothetical protein
MCTELYDRADAVIGTTLFGAVDVIEFGRFDRTFITLFQITCGATWVTYLPVGDYHPYPVRVANCFLKSC